MNHESIIVKFKKTKSHGSITEFKTNYYLCAVKPRCEIIKRFFGLAIESAKFKSGDQRMEAPLAIRAWTLLYSSERALAEPDSRNNDNRPRLFFIFPRILRLPVTAPGFSYLQTLFSFSRLCPEIPV